MAASKLKSVSALTADMPAFQNVLRAQMSASYQDRIPVATQENLAQTAVAVLENPVYANEYLSALVDRIFYAYIHEYSLSNKFAEFKRGFVEYGRTMEEIGVDIINAEMYDPEVAETTVWKRNIPPVSAIFHTINRENFYTVTLENELLRRAFVDGNAMTRLANQIINTLYNSDNYDEWLIFKNLFSAYNAAQLFYPVVITEPTDADTAKSFIQQVRATITSIGLPSRKYNSLGMMRDSRPEDLVLFMKPELEALVDVEVLAAAFNMSKAEFLARRVVIDDFGTGTDDIQAVLVDRNWFVQYDTVFRTEEIYNPKGLYWNIFLHHHGIYSTSRFAPAVAFTTKASSAATITLNPSAPSLAKGASQTFKATVAATSSSGDYAPQNVIWSLTGNTSSGTTLNPSGQLVISPHETAESLTVTATSTFNSATKGTATVTVTG